MSSNEDFGSRSMKNPLETSKRNSKVSNNRRQPSPTGLSTAPRSRSLRIPPLAGHIAPFDAVAAQLEFTTLEVKSTAASIKSKASRPSTIAESSRTPSVKESIYSRSGSLQHVFMLENARSSASSLAGSTSSRSSVKVFFSSSSGPAREINGSAASARNSWSRSMAGSIKELFSGSSGSTKESGGYSIRNATASEWALSVGEPLHSRSGTIKQSSRPQTSRASSIKELFSSTSSVSTKGSSGSKQYPARHGSSISSADEFRRDCTIRAERVREALSRTPLASINTPSEPRLQSDSYTGTPSIRSVSFRGPPILVSSSGPRSSDSKKGRSRTGKSDKLPDVSPRTAKFAFAIAQSMGGPEMPKGLEKKLSDKKHSKK